VEKVCIHPLGFFAQMDTLDYCPRWKQILVLLLGPSSVIITYALLKFCCSFNLISIYTYQYGIKINFIIFFFNLIPCLPLDGGKIMMIILASFFSELKARIINLSISLICLILMTGFLFSLYDLMMFIFLFFNLGLSLINLQKDYQTFLIERRLIGKFSKIRINKKKEIFRYNDNYYLIDNQIYHEKEMFDLKVK
jgi:stage IV sporulation protein FB